MVDLLRAKPSACGAGNIRVDPRDVVIPSDVIIPVM